ncbi:hypothetical protein HDU81_002986 [Chytriomyces hyalinus]|nr:hypothetical protein HDU81_002986 [Chytriomyces hyalinus]
MLASIFKFVPNDISEYCTNYKTRSFTHQGGDVLGAINIVPIFFGPNRFQPETLQFYKDILSSNYTFFLQEYNTPFTAISKGTVSQPITIDFQYDPKAGDKIISDTQDIQPVLAQLAALGKITPTKNTYYPIHYGPNLTISSEGGVSCTNWIGEHSAMYAPNIPNPIVYSHLPDRLHPGCSKYASFDSFSGSVTVYAHELTEAWTDPVPPSGWVNVQEIADLCAGNRGTVPATGVNAGMGTYSVVKYWSNLQNQCVMGA